MWCYNGNISKPSNGRPLAQAWEQFPPKPVARSHDPAPTHTHATSTLHQPALNMAQPTDDDAHHNPHTPPDTSCKMVAKIPYTILETLQTSCAVKASISLLGRIQGKHPNFKALTTWAKETLRPSLTLLSLISNNVFKGRITFERPKRRIHALNQAELVCDSTTIFFFN